MHSVFVSALISVSILWVALEVGLGVFRRSGASAARRDDGSLRLLHLVIYASTGVGMYLGGTGHGHLPLPFAFRWLGLALMIVGIALRLWAIACLSRFFTVDVAIAPDHVLIESGPYRVVRHPSYTGLLVAFLGLSMTVSSWLSVAIIVPGVAFALVHRIRIEEAALAGAFPEQYPRYCARTSRLFPGIW